MINDDFFQNETDLIKEVSDILGVQPEQLKANIDENIIQHLIGQVKISKQEKRERSKAAGNLHGIIQLRIKVKDLYDRSHRQSIRNNTPLEDGTSFQEFKRECKVLCNDIARYEKNPQAQQSRDNTVMLDDALVQRKAALLQKGSALQNRYNTFLTGQNNNNSESYYGCQDSLPSCNLL